MAAIDTTTLSLFTRSEKCQGRVVSRSCFWRWNYSTARVSMGGCARTRGRRPRGLLASADRPPRGWPPRTARADSPRHRRPPICGWKSRPAHRISRLHSAKSRRVKLLDFGLATATGEGVAGPAHRHAWPPSNWRARPWTRGPTLYGTGLRALRKWRPALARSSERSSATTSVASVTASTGACSRGQPRASRQPFRN